ncbi:hypothetical protein ASG49_16335 [Marmoricola sp. Leaf446]|uniref:hypothetical protein n=1 Tax=Marmoricola sp. Leaf446 TaxID=1736379 RepID=UPI0006F9ADE7|nr:hypothetical protein [Marmoricola sp. Leaf446]KQT89345.1 hypothetical protein ASG49_16335 [Marmoricola sp. Leaf446]
MVPLAVPLHLGPLHPAEQLLTLLLAFGPFVLLGVTIWLSRRRDAREDEPAPVPAPDAAGPGTGAVDQAPER